MEEGFVCPHCNYNHEESYQFINPSDAEASIKMVCEECGETFCANFWVKSNFETENCKEQSNQMGEVTTIKKG